MIDAMNEERATMPTPLNVDTMSPQQEQGMLDALKGTEWSGQTDYECFNMFSVGVDDKGDLADLRVLNNRSNSVLLEMRKR